MIAIAFNIGDALFAVLALFHVHVNAASARTHVACGLPNFVRDFGRSVYFWLDCHLARFFSFPCHVKNIIPASINTAMKIVSTTMRAMAAGPTDNTCLRFVFIPTAAMAISRNQREA